jgi:Transposase domain (DUF772)
MICGGLYEAASSRGRIEGRAHCFLSAWSTGFMAIIQFGSSTSLSRTRPRRAWVWRGRSGSDRPAFVVLLKFYIYGYLSRVQSSPRLEHEAGRNVEVMWLTGRLSPNHKTTADFRKDNGRAVRQVRARFVALCRPLRRIRRGPGRRYPSLVTVVVSKQPDQAYPHRDRRRAFSQLRQGNPRFCSTFWARQDGRRSRSRATSSQYRG